LGQRAGEKNYRVSPYCPRCGTALSNFEVNQGYKEVKDESIYVKFKLQGKEEYFLVWTTTPWTLPANLAIALHPDFEYTLIKIISSNNKNLKNDSYIIIAKDLLENVIKLFNITAYDIVKSFKGRLLENTNAIHPFYNRPSKIILAEHVTLDQGTGLVHTAPGHGLEDYIVGLKYNLEVYNPVDELLEIL